MKRALHLLCQRLDSLVLDGPALKITLEHTSPQYFPLRRLSHIVLIGQPRCDISALWQIVRTGISVSWLNLQGQLQALLTPANAEQCDFASLLEQSLYDPVLRQLLTEWFDNQYIHSLSVACKTLPVSTSQPQYITNQLHKYLNQKLGKAKRQRAQDWLQALTLAALQPVLQQHKLHPYCLGVEQLQQQLCRCLQPWLLSYLIHWAATHQTVNAQSMADLYSQHQPELEYHQQRLLLQLLSDLIRWSRL